jgi:hypothetical protein
MVALLTGAGGSIGGSGSAWHLELKPFWLLHIMSGYSFVLSAVSVTALIAVIYLLRLRGELKPQGPGLWLTATFLLHYLVLPSKLFDTSFVDFRVLVAAALILPAFLAITAPDRRTAWTLAIVAVAITAANVALVTSVWTSYNAEYRALIESFGRIEKNRLVLVAHNGDAPDPPLRNLIEYPMYHAPTLAVHYATAFVPTLFMAPGKQPVSVSPANARLFIPYGGPAPISILKGIADGKIAGDIPAFVRNWHRDYDYLYVLGTPSANPMPDLLERIDAGSRFVLYRVRRQGSR